MDKWHKILGGALLLAFAYIIFLQGCGAGPRGDTREEIKVVVRDSVHIDTNWYDTTVFKYLTVNIPKPYYDTTRILLPVYTENDFDQMMSHPAIYEDSTVKDDTVTIYYKATIRGYLDDLKLGYKIYKPYLIKKTRTVETEITKIKRPWTIYAGLDAGANKDGLVHLAPMLELVTPKMTFSGGYDLNDQGFVIGVKAKISFRKKPKPELSDTLFVPHP